MWLSHVIYPNIDNETYGGVGNMGKIAIGEMPPRSVRHKHKRHGADNTWKRQHQGRRQNRPRRAPDLQNLQYQSGMVTGLVTHFYMLANKLTNWDDINNLNRPGVIFCQLQNRLRRFLSILWIDADGGIAHNLRQRACV